MTRAGLRFPPELVLKLFLEADTNQDGVIQYEEFMPAMLEVIAAMKEGIVDAAAEEFAMPNPADVPADMMADYLQKLFKIADTNDDGVLSPVEFADLLSRSGFNFPAHVIVSLVKAADVNEDGVIEYEEFVPAMLGLMEAANEADLTPDVGEGVPMWDEVPDEMLERYLSKLFQIGDTNGDGVLQPQEFLELLTRAGLRFPAELVLKLFLEADVNHDGVIEYDEFMPAMLAVVAAMKEGAAEAAEEEEEEEAAEAPLPMPNPADVPADMMADYLQKLFKIADTNDDGVLTPTEFAELLSRSGFNFPAHVIVSLVKAADVNEDGVIEYEEC